LWTPHTAHTTGDQPAETTATADWSAKPSADSQRTRCCLALERRSAPQAAAPCPASADRAAIALRGCICLGV
jgi:hypothetical protein